jgi:hypothetical protein
MLAKPAVLCKIQCERRRMNQFAGHIQRCGPLHQPDGADRWNMNLVKLQKVSG